MSEPFAYDVFLSHSSKDKPAVRALAERLRADGLRVWLDEWAILPGDNIPLAIEDGIQRSRILILFMSANAFGSDWVHLERHAVLFRDPANRSRRFIPLRLDDAKIPDLIAQFAYLDWSHPDDEVYRKLLAVCRNAIPAASAKENSLPATVGVASGSLGVALTDVGVDRGTLGAAQTDVGVVQTMPGVAHLDDGVALTDVGVDHLDDGVDHLDVGVDHLDVGVEEYGSKVENEDASVEVDTENNSLILKGHSNFVNAVAISHDGQVIASSSQDNNLKLWDTKTGKCLKTLQGHTGGVLSVAISHNGQFLASGSMDKTLKLWDIKNGECLKTLQGHLKSVWAVTISHDGHFLASGSSDKTLKLWDIKTGECLKTLQGHTDRVLSVAISHDGQFLASGSMDTTLKLWDIETGKCLNTLEGHTGPVWSITISHDGKTVVSGSMDTTLKIWDIETGKCLNTLEGHTECVFGVAMSDERPIIVSGSDDYTLRLWDSETGECLATLTGHTHLVSGVTVSYDGKIVISGSADKTIRIWNVDAALTASKATREKAITRYTNVKVLLVGDSGVGKTGLAMRLTENSFEPTISTHGAWATQMKMPGTDLQKDAAADGIEREIWLWDFGGQADYRLIHQLFMDETALAVVVFDPQKDDLFEGIGQWERDMARAARKPFPRILVAGRKDRGGIRVSRESMGPFCQEKKFAEYIETSAQTGDGCTELREAILRHIDWSKFGTTTSPRIFKLLKEAMLALRDGGEVLLRHSELQQQMEMRLPEEKFTPEQLRTVVSLLSGPGLVWKLDFGDFVLLRPEWINAYAGAMVRTVRAHPDELGCMDEAALLSGELDYQDMQRIAPDEERFVLLALHETLLKYGLCLRETTEQGNRLVFPAYFRRERPERTEHPYPIATYRFSGMLEEIYTTLVVRLHHTKTFDTDQLWRNAADFKTTTGKEVGLNLTRLPEGSGEITAYSDPALSIEKKVDFLLYVHEHILSHAADVVRTRRYVCPHCSTPVANQAAVVKRLEAGKQDIICVNCEERILLWDEIEERFASEETRVIVRQMQIWSQNVLDNQSRERILVGDVTSRVSEAGQIFRETPHSDWGIDGEIEFKNPQNQATGKRVYAQLKSGDSHLRHRKSDDAEVFDIPEDRHIEYWQAQAYDVYLIIRDGKGAIRWMNITAALKSQTRPGRQVVFKGEPFTAQRVYELRNRHLGIS